MRNKEKLHEWIDRYNNNDLSGEELVIFLEMMNRDYRVREEVMLDYELNSVLKETDILELRKKIRKICSEHPVKKNFSPRIILMAATLVILFSIEYAIYYLNRPAIISNRSESGYLQNSPWQKQIDQLNASYQYSTDVYSIFNRDKLVALGIDTKEKEIAFDVFACFQPNKVLENLIGTIRSGDFQMLTPPKSATFTHNNSICFSWKTTNPEETSLIIENNKGIVVYESDSNLNQKVLIKASFLNSGLFYYKIIRKDDVIYFGKFTIQ
jgi:hypothetical protein